MNLKMIMLNEKMPDRQLAYSIYNSIKHKQPILTDQCWLGYGGWVRTGLQRDPRKILRY